jgi:hypothetical protein
LIGGEGKSTRQPGAGVGVIGMAKKHEPDDVRIGKFDILATYTYAKGLLDGLDDEEARERGMVAAVMGAKARLGQRGSHPDDYEADKDAAEQKKKTTITAESFDQQVATRWAGSSGRPSSRA